VSKPCTPVVHIKIAGKWMFIPLKMVLIGIDPYPYSLYGQNKKNDAQIFDVFRFRSPMGSWNFLDQVAN